MRFTRSEKAHVDLQVFDEIKAEVELNVSGAVSDRFSSVLIAVRNSAPPHMTVSYSTNYRMSPKAPFVS